MQNILDEIQKDTVQELDKVSLERLADINPDLLANIKQAAQDLPTSTTTAPPSYFTETRSPAQIERSAAWQQLSGDPRTQTHDVIAQLQQAVRTAGSSLYTQTQVGTLTRYYGVAAAVSTVLTTAWEEYQQKYQPTQRPTTLLPTVVDLAHFTNEGIKEKNNSVVGLLYEMGLPFQSSADGRRFRTELELSQHLDALFQKNQIEKSMTKTEERGWYESDRVWMKMEKETSEPTEGGVEDEPVADPEQSVMPADESRDRCVICGINFHMFFDNDNGIYMYSNCREIEVLNDDAAEKDSEEMLVHVTCWRGLGAPEVLTSDQALQETLHTG